MNQKKRIIRVTSPKPKRIIAQTTKRKARALIAAAHYFADDAQTGTHWEGCESAHWRCLLLKMADAIADAHSIAPEVTPDEVSTGNVEIRVVAGGVDEICAPNFHMERLDYNHIYFSIRDVTVWLRSGKCKLTLTHETQLRESSVAESTDDEVSTGAADHMNQDLK